MVSVKHTFHSNKDDGTDSQLVRPSNWNEEHAVTVTTGGVALGRPVGAGAGAIQEVSFDTITGGLFPVGSVIAFAGLAAPTGWYMCDASLKSTTTDAALFAVCQYAYGGSGASFALPDLRGRSICAPDGGMGRNAAATVPGVAGGASTSSTGTITSSGSNTFNFGNLTFTQTSGKIAQTGLLGVATGGGSSAAQLNDDVTVAGYTTLNANHGVSVSGASGAFNIIPPMITMNYIIKR